MGALLEDLLKRLRERGWRVAQHSDSMNGAALWTYWLFIHADGVYVHGGGATDNAAVEQAIREAEEKHPDLI